MSILQETFDKHKKLMLESIMLLNETELYHATSKENAEKIKVDGPNISLSGKNFSGAGEDQGKGFYFYRNKKTALSHAEEHGEEVILVFDETISSGVFDIDYEAGYEKAAKYVIDNLDFFKKHSAEMDIMVYTKNPEKPTIYVSGKNLQLWLRSEDVFISSANKMAELFRRVEKIDKSQFDRFELAFLLLSPAVKYNGMEKILPIRIEDLKSNVLWKK